MNIEKTLQERFAAPLQENYKRRIVFWQDPEGEFSSMVNGGVTDLLSTLRVSILSSMSPVGIFGFLL